MTLGVGMCGWLAVCGYGLGVLRLHAGSALSRLGFTMSTTLFSILAACLHLASEGACFAATTSGQSGRRSAFGAQRPAPRGGKQPPTPARRLLLNASF